MIVHQNYGIITNCDYHVQNNAWGYNGNGNPPQTVSGPPGDGVGWQWNWPGHDHSRVISYPSIIYGKKPFNNQSSCASLPKKFDDLNSLSATYSINTDAAIGVFNTAFDLWLTSSAASDEASIKAEVMIWVANSGLNPAGTMIDSIPTPYGIADLYRATVQSWRYFAYVLRDEQTDGTIDFLVFLSDLVHRGAFTPQSVYVASVEFGNEIAYGRGLADLADYSVSIS